MLNTVGPAPIRAFPGGTFNTLVERARRAPVQVNMPGRIVRAGDGFDAENVSGEDIPMGAILRIIGAAECQNAPTILKVDKPNSQYQVIYAVALAPIGEESMGPCTLYDPCRAFYLASDGTPAYGESWGPTNGQWYLRKNRPGFAVAGYAEDGLCTVVPTPHIGWARKIHFSLTQQLTISMASATCSIITAYDGVHPANGFEDGPIVHNVESVWASENGAKGGASYDPGSGKYWIDWLECVED